MDNYPTTSNNVDTSWAITGLPSVVDVINTIGYILSAIYLVLQIIGWWHVFKKAGERPWKSIIPVYDLYIQIKLTWNVKFFWMMLCSLLLTALFRILTLEIGGFFTTFFVIMVVLLNIFIVVLYVIAQYWFSKSMNHGIPYCIGLIILPFIFTPILGLGKSEYIGNAYEKKHKN